MPAPTPPKSVKSSCSVIHEGTLYVYSPDAFQSIQLQEDAKWQELENGVSVAGAACVTASVDGDDSVQALYVIGGSGNSSTSNYSGLQRYSFGDESWTTVELPSEVMRNRLRHGASLIPRDHKLVVYGGSAIDGYVGDSSDTFTIDLKPPYPVSGYDAKLLNPGSRKTIPPASRPFIMPWGFDSVIMAGGSSLNKGFFTFTSGGGWFDLNLDVSEPLPDASVAQAAMFTLDDSSKIMQIFQLGQDPIGVTSHVLLNPGALPATPGQIIGSTSASPPSAKLLRRQFLSNYPSYNDTSVPSTTRTDFSIAQSTDGMLAIVGGDTDGSVTFFNQAQNDWVPAQALLGEAPQEILQPSSSSTSSSTTTPTSTPTGAPTATSTSAASNGPSSGTRTWTILGGVLGGLCGLVAILIILLLCIRNKRREKKRAAAAGQPGHTQKSYPAGKKASTDLDFEDGLHPLRENGQPMGRSPVASQIIMTDTRGSAALFSAARPPRENLIRRVSSDNRSQPDTNAATYGIFRREKSPLAKSSLAISKPMNPNLGDYSADRPSIDLGRATPASPVNATPMVAIPSRNKSQRKTDEAWAKYFTAGKANADQSQRQPTSPIRGHKSGNSNSGFWPGSGVPSAPVPPKFAFRDSAGNTLQTQSVGTASPALENGPTEPCTRHFAAIPAERGRISNANSLSSAGSEYEDDTVDPAFSSGVPTSVGQQNSWGGAPGGHSWAVVGGGREGRERSYNPPPTAYTTNTTNTNSLGGASTGTGSSGGIPNFPMPGTSTPKEMLGNVQHPGGAKQDGYFPMMGGQQEKVNTDVSWLNLGANKEKTVGR